MSEVTNTLAERGQRYGDFKEHAEITQDLKKEMRICEKWNALSNDKKEALEMIAHKIGRILNGDPEYRDSWIDIAGYAAISCRPFKDLIPTRRERDKAFST